MNSEQYDAPIIVLQKTDRRKHLISHRLPLLAIVWSIGLGLLIIQGKLAEQNLQLRNQELLEDNYALKQPHLATCQYVSPNGDIIEHVDCKVINQQYAKVN